MARFRLHHNEADHSKPGYCLVDALSPLPPLRVDFGTAEFRRRLKAASRRSELIAKAVKAEAGLRVLDCTGGLGRDAFLLAHLGCAVTLCERSEVVFTLLADGIKRALADERDETLATAAARIQLHNADAAAYIKGSLKGDLKSNLKSNLKSYANFDVIYLDPMFPARAKSAKVKGDMQRLQAFLGATIKEALTNEKESETGNETESETANLLQLALDSGVGKTVLKRPAKSSWQPPVKPNHVISSRVSRFEIYLPAPA